MKKQIVMLVAVSLAAMLIVPDNPVVAGVKKLVDWDSVLTYWGTDDMTTDSTRIANVDLFGPIPIASPGANRRYDRAIGALYVPAWTASDTDAIGARDTILFKIYGYAEEAHCSVLIDSQITVQTDSTDHTFFIDIDGDNFFAGKADTSGAGLYFPKDHMEAFMFDFWRVYFTRADSARVGMVEATDSAYMAGIRLWFRFEED